MIQAVIETPSQIRDGLYLVTSPGAFRAHHILFHALDRSENNSGI
jgi:hypothetical protein